MKRTLTVGGALLMFLFCFLAFGQRVTSNQLGRDLTMALSWLGFFYCLLAGPLVTVDCLAREQREGTLGLLFLTDLRGYDIVFGKMAAASLQMLLGLAAALPVVALPALMGGSNFTQFAHIALALLHIMFLSLAVGLCMSSLVSSGRFSLGLTLVALSFLTLGVPTLGDEVLGISERSPLAAWAYSVCPLWTMRCCLNFAGTRVTPGEYWLSLAGLQAVTWLCLGFAGLRASRSWQTPPGEPPILKSLKRFALWTRRRAAFRRAWRKSMMGRNPVAWLEGRNRAGTWLMWVLILASPSFWLYHHLRAPQSWLDQSTVVLWPVWSHYILCAWLAIEAPRRLADDKHSGALELLLCTPLQPRQILRGCLWPLRTQFGRAVFVLLALDFCMAGAYFSSRGGWQAFRKNDLYTLSLCAAVVFPAQAWSLARVGLYQGLRQTSSLRATFMLAWKLGLLPWLSFVALMLGYELSQRYLGVRRGLSNNDISFCWAGVHMFFFGLFVVHASWHLRRHFRYLASQPVVPSWWRRLTT